MPSIFARSVYVFVLSCLSAFIMTVTLDQPLAHWALLHLSHEPLILLFCQIPKAIIFMVLIIYCVCSIRRWLQRYTHTDHVLLAVANSVSITYFFSQFFKPAFTRHWPIEPPLYVSPVYSHTAYLLSSELVAATIAAAVILLVAYPRGRVFIVSLSLITVVALVTQGYCYLSEAIVGAALGFIIGYGVADKTNLEHAKTEVYPLG